MNTLELIPRDGAILARLAELEQKYKGFKMFEAEKILHSGTVYRIAGSVSAGNLSGRLYIRFNLSGFTLYLMNGYIQPLGEYINNTFQPSQLGQFYDCEVERVLNYLLAHGLFTDVKKTVAEG